MAERNDTIAPVRPIPYLLGRVASQDVSLPIRNGSAGALVVPTSGTITVQRADGTYLVTAGTTTAPSSIPTYTLPTMVGADLGAGWTVVWDQVISGVPYSWRYEAFVCDFIPSCAISVIDLFSRESELRHRVPQAQGPRGTNEGWQPQVDEAYFDLIQALIDRGEPVWTIRGLTGLRAWLRARALMLCCRQVSQAKDDEWDRKAGIYYAEHKEADGSLVIQRDTEPATTRTSRGPYRLAPAGRPSW